MPSKTRRRCLAILVALATLLLPTESLRNATRRSTERYLAVVDKHYALLPSKNVVTSDSSLFAAKQSVVCEPSKCTAECAQACFERVDCNYFVVEQPANADGMCLLYRHLVVDEDATASGKTVGYMKTPPPTFLSRRVPCSAPSHKLLSVGTFCAVDADGKATANKADIAASFYMPVGATCAASKELLYRAYAAAYITEALSEKIADPKKAPNAKEMAPDVRGGTFAWGDLGDSGAQKKFTVQRKGGATEWTYTFDRQGRVTGASADLKKENLLSSGPFKRDDYCLKTFQERFNLIHGLESAKAQRLPFNAGHVVGCQFTNPNGFWNFVVQNAESNQRGCWYQAEREVARLLKLGCSGTFEASLDYFGDVFKPQPFQHGELFTAQDFKDLYGTSRQRTATTKPFLVDYPCGFTYRPHTMTLTFQLGAPESGSACAKLPPKLTVLFTTQGSDSVQITRPLARWLLAKDTGKSSKFTGLKGLATASSGQCTNELGRSLKKIVFLDEFHMAEIRVGGKCLGENAQVHECESGEITRFSQPGATVFPPTPLDGQDATFRFANAIDGSADTVAFPGGPQDLVAGYLVAGNKCAKLDSSGNKIIAAAFSGAPSDAACTLMHVMYVEPQAIEDNEADPIGDEDEKRTVSPVEEEEEELEPAPSSPRQPSQKKIRVDAPANG